MPMLTLMYKIYTYGATALHYTAPKGHLFVTELFLAAGANTYLVDEDDQTAFDLSLAVTIMMSVG